MNTFHDLFRQPTRKLGAEFPPDRRRELFPGFVERSPRLHLLAPGSPALDAGSHLLVGVATWSGYDMNLLDLIEESPAGDVQVDVFDIDAGDWEQLFEGSKPLQSPAAALRVDGRLVEAAGGAAARDLIRRVLQLPAGEVDQRLSTVLSRQ